MIETAVILAGGRATRFAPLSSYVPKQLLPLGRKPIIEWLVQEIMGASITEIVLVSGPASLAMECYFEALAEKYHFRSRIVCQSEPLGTADALLRARRYLHGPFFVCYGDEIWLGDPSRAQQLCANYAGFRRSVLPVVRVDDPQLLLRLGVVDVDVLWRPGLHLIRGIVEKPSPGKAPSNLAMVSGAVLDIAILEELEKAARLATVHRERYLTEAIGKFSQSTPVYALELTGEWVDAGTLEQYPKAFVQAALAEGGDEFRSFLASVVQQ